jgi:hypothetical protein
LLFCKHDFNHLAKSDAVIRDSPSLGKAKAVQPLLGKAVKAHPFIHTKDNQSDEEKAIYFLISGRFSACYQHGSDA